jgi:hypothetical protein
MTTTTYAMLGRAVSRTVNFTLMELQFVYANAALDTYCMIYVSLSSNFYNSFVSTIFSIIIMWFYIIFIDDNDCN